MTTPFTRRRFLARAVTALAAVTLCRLPEFATTDELPVVGARRGLPAEERVNAVYTRWLDQNGQMQTELVEDVESIVRNGYRPTHTVAYVCKSREQAMHHGRWVLMQQQNES